MEVKSSVSPTGAEGACMEVYNDELFLYGGKHEDSFRNELWSYNLGSNEYRAYPTGIGIPEIAYSNCHVVGSNLYILNGIMDGTKSPKDI